jgi:hypothetical protein
VLHAQKLADNSRADFTALLRPLHSAKPPGVLHKGSCKLQALPSPNHNVACSSRAALAGVAAARGLGSVIALQQTQAHTPAAADMLSTQRCCTVGRIWRCCGHRLRLPQPLRPPQPPFGKVLLARLEAVVVVRSVASVEHQQCLFVTNEAASRRRQHQHSAKQPHSSAAETVWQSGKHTTLACNQPV